MFEGFKMKKLIIGLATVSVLGVSLFAMGGNCNNKRGGFMMKPIMMELNLSDAQRGQIKDIISKTHNSMERPSDAFSESGFDKSKFIKISKGLKDNMIEKKAGNIEKIYNILTDEQKVEFLKLIKERKTKGLKMKHHRGFMQ